MSYHRLRRLIMQITQIIFLVSMAGCGYTTRSLISDKFRTIYIAPFDNKVDIAQEAYSANRYRIYRPGLETDIMRAVVNKYLFDGNLKPVKEQAADLVLKGELIEFRKDPLRYNENSDEVAEYRVNIIVNLTLLDKKENKEVWKESGFTGDTTYFTTGSLAKSEETAINDAISDLARRIVERTVEQW